MILQCGLQSHSISESLTSVPREPVFYSVLSQINNVQMTKESHSAAASRSTAYAPSSAGANPESQTLSGEWVFLRYRRAETLPSRPCSGPQRTARRVRDPG